MNEQYKPYLIFVAGAAVGSLITYFFTKHHYEEEIVDIQNSYKDEIRLAKKVSENVETTTQVINKMKSDILKYHYTSAAIEEDGTEEIAARLYPTDEVYQDPYIISEDEYNEPVPNYDKVAVTYFVDDDILVEDLTYQPIDLDNTVTRENLDALVRGEEDLMYVRCERLSIDYEVQRTYEDFESAQQYHEGYVEEDFD